MSSEHEGWSDHEEGTEVLATVEVAKFSRGDWLTLLRQSESIAEEASRVACRRWRTRVDTLERRAERAAIQVQMGEISSGRLALEGAPLAPGSRATREALSEPVRRPPRAREDLSEEVRVFQPRAQFVLDQDTFLKCLRTAERGAAGGPSGMTIEHIRYDSSLLFHAAEELSRGNMPDEVIRMLRMGRMTVLQKLRGGVRGIVAGDIVRRLVSRAMAKQPMPQSCQSMASARMIQYRGGQCWTASEVSVTEWPCHSSAFFWGPFPVHMEDDEGIVHDISQGEGRE